MYYNGVKCDIYIGKGAGKKLLSDIRSATKSVKIVSPYLSPSMISELIKLRNNNLNIELITIDNIEDYYGNYERNIHKLIIQNRITDSLAFAKREKWKFMYKVLVYLLMGVIITMIGASYFLNYRELAYGIIPIVFLFLISRLFKYRIKKKRIYTYQYSQLFPFKVFMTPGTNQHCDTFIHSKIYLIDDKIAYLGSLNFTGQGTKNNYESRIRITDSKAILEINKEFDWLMYKSNLPERNIQQWGKKLYNEYIN